MCRFARTSIIERVRSAFNSKDEKELKHLFEVLETNPEMKEEFLEGFSGINNWVEASGIFYRFESAFN